MIRPRHAGRRSNGSDLRGLRTTRGTHEARRVRGARVASGLEKAAARPFEHEAGEAAGHEGAGIDADAIVSHDG